MTLHSILLLVFVLAVIAPKTVIPAVSRFLRELVPFVIKAAEFVITLIAKILKGLVDVLILIVSKCLTWLAQLLRWLAGQLHNLFS